MITVKKLVETFKKKKINIGNKVKIKYVKDRPGHDFRYALNSNKIKKTLNWKPKISLSLGIIKTVEWYLNNKSFFSKISKELFVKRLGNR
jgi:dTDP-glucose 4,6-dehydratase